MVLKSSHTDIAASLYSVTVQRRYRTVMYVHCMAILTTKDTWYIIYHLDC